MSSELTYSVRGARPARRSRSRPWGSACSSSVQPYRKAGIPLQTRDQSHMTVDLVLTESWQSYFSPVFGCGSLQQVCRRFAICFERTTIFGFLD